MNPNYEAPSPGLNFSGVRKATEKKPLAVAGVSVDTNAELIDTLDNFLELRFAELEVRLTARLARLAALAVQIAVRQAASALGVKVE